ncbi:class I SAM-dependent methyltransferase [Kordiimonas sp.]|uniref:class I SAM-dependent methyltransferase n=1 Tax=Kordiimonas sp. TaxID=1970157 RepID=UPI003A9142F0
MSELLTPFSDPEAVRKYVEGPPKFVPGLAGLHRMTGILLAEHAPRDAHVLVVGAGGGMEMKAFADAYSGWTFTGVDPAPQMLALASDIMGEHAPRARLIEGYIDAAPQDEPFDAATCMLVLHFLSTEDRLQTLREIKSRLKPGAPFIAAHSSFPQDESRVRWLGRYAAFALGSGADTEKVETMRSAIETHLNLLSPAEEEDLLRSAGFSGVEIFYTGFTFRGWVAYA